MKTPSSVLAEFNSEIIYFKVQMLKEFWLLFLLDLAIVNMIF